MPIDHVPLDAGGGSLSELASKATAKVGKIVGIGLKSPYCRLRCGEANVVFAQTLPKKRGMDTPTWTESENNVVNLRRPTMGVGNPTDGGLLIVEVWDDNKRRPDVYIGGNVLQLDKYIDAPNRDHDEVLEMLSGEAAADSDTLRVGQVLSPSVGLQGQLG